MKCRLLYLVGQLGLGGLERQLYYLLETMDREQYKPAVIVWNYSEEDTYVRPIQALGVPLHFLPTRLPAALKLKALRRLVRQLSPEVLHSYSFYTNFAAYYATLGSKVIRIGSIRGNLYSARRNSGWVLGRLSARWPATKICNSLATKKTGEQCTGLFKPGNLHLVSNRLDINRFKYFPIAQAKPVLLSIGRLCPEKRWDRLFRSLSLVVSRGLDFSIQLVGDGPLRDELETQVRNLGLEKFVQFLGIRQDIPALLQGSNFLVHTAESEGCPNVVMEAMACGRAVVAMDAGDIPYLVEDGKTGFVVRQGDEKALAERIAMLINDHELCGLMGKRGRAKSEHEFSLDTLVVETLEVYQGVGWANT